MISKDKQNTVIFSTRINTGFGNAVYVKGDAQEIKEPQRLEVRNDECWYLEVFINPNQDFPKDKVNYVYFIASFDDPNINVQEFTENLQNSFNLKDLRKQGHKDVKLLDESGENKGMPLERQNEDQQRERAQLEAINQTKDLIQDKERIQRKDVNQQEISTDIRSKQSDEEKRIKERVEILNQDNEDIETQRKHVEYIPAKEDNTNVDRKQKKI